MDILYIHPIFHIPGTCLKTSVSIFFWWKDRALKQQSALIAILVMTAFFFSFITNTLHQPFLCPPTMHSALLFNILSCDNRGKTTNLTWILFLSSSQTDAHKHIALTYTHLFCPVSIFSHLPLYPPLTIL